MPENKPFTFEQTRINIYGDPYAYTAMESGLVIARQVVMRYLGDERDHVYRLEFQPLKDMIPFGHHLELVQFKNGYRYKSDSLTFFLRTDQERRDNSLYFQLQGKDRKQKLKVETARKLGIVLS
jgi:hypothetical protein